VGRRSCAEINFYIKYFVAGYGKTEVINNIYEDDEKSVYIYDMRRSPDAVKLRF
jgi:hypothetical protein